MNGPPARQADKRVAIALSVLAVILMLLGAQAAFRGASPAGESVQMASTMVSSPAR